MVADTTPWALKPEHLAAITQALETDASLWRAVKAWGTVAARDVNVADMGMFSQAGYANPAQVLIETLRVVRED